MRTVVVVVKRTAYADCMDRAGASRVDALAQRHDPALERLRRSHEEHESTVEEVAHALDTLGVKARWIRRAHASFDGDDADLVLTVGGDGTLLGASHHVGAGALLGINSSPTYSVGFFCGTKKGRVRPALERALAGRLSETVLTRMQVCINDVPVVTRVLNEALFAHRSPAGTSRYSILRGRRVERHRSSGFWVGPAAGSTAAQHAAGGQILPLSSTSLQFVVREPYRPAGEPIKLTRLLVEEGQRLIVRSEMQDGLLFFDGPHHWVGIDIGDRLTFEKSDESIRVLGLPSSRPKWHRLI